MVAFVAAYSTLFTVYQTRQALVIRLGEPIREITQPGLNVKIPLIDTVIQIDKRILDIESSEQEVIASDYKRLKVDAFARYKITKPLLFYQTVGSVEGGNARLLTLLNSSLRRVLGAVTLMQTDFKRMVARFIHPQSEGVVPLNVAYCWAASII